MYFLSTVTNQKEWWKRLKIGSLKVHCLEVN